MAAGLAIEELAYADFNIANAVIPVVLMSALIHRHATPRVRAEWLGPLASGETFRRVRTDRTEFGFRCRRTADQGNANAMIVTARTYRGGQDAGVSAFSGRPRPTGCVEIGHAGRRLAAPGSGLVHFDEVAIPADALIGPESSAFRAVLNGFGFTRPPLALTGIGCAQACLDETAEYVRTRTAFGSPATAFEGYVVPARRARDNTRNGPTGIRKSCRSSSGCVT